MTTEEIMQQALNTLEGLFGIHGEVGGEFGGELSRDSFKRWPVAAAEHFFRLRQDFASENNLSRHDRLHKAISRIQKRYGHLCVSTSSNQPAA